LIDVSTASLSNGNCLVWNSSTLQFEAGSCGSGAAGSISTITASTNINISGSTGPVVVVSVSSAPTFSGTITTAAGVSASTINVTTQAKFTGVNTSTPIIITQSASPSADQILLINNSGTKLFSVGFGSGSISTLGALNYIGAHVVSTITYNATETDSVLIATCPPNTNMVIQLPGISQLKVGHQYIIYKNDPSTNTVTVQANGFDKLSSQSGGLVLAGGSTPALLLSTAGAMVELIADNGNNWMLLNQSDLWTGVVPGNYNNANVTVNERGQVTSISTGSSGGVSVYPATSTIQGTFKVQFNAAQAKLPSSAFPFISNSTAEFSSSVYFDDTSTQSVTWDAVMVDNYDGRPLFADLIFTTTNTANFICWNVYTATNTPNSSTNNYDSSTFNAAVSTAIRVSSSQLALSKATVQLSNTTTTNGDFLTIKVDRQTGGCGNTNAVGFGRLKKVRIYE